MVIYLRPGTPHGSWMGASHTFRAERKKRETAAWHRTFPLVQSSQTAEPSCVIERFTGKWRNYGEEQGNECERECGEGRRGQSEASGAPATPSPLARTVVTWECALELLFQVYTYIRINIRFAIYYTTLCLLYRYTYSVSSVYT